MTGLMKVTWGGKLLTLMTTVWKFACSCRGSNTQRSMQGAQHCQQLKVTNLDEDDTLRFQLQTHAMTTVIQEVLQPQELHSTQFSPVPPEHSDLQLPRLAHHM